MFGLIRTTIIALVLAFNAGSILAQDYQKGLSAYHAGDFVATLQEWRPLAEQGNASAQSYLGDMYYEGEGLPQDFTEAVRWYRLSAEQGDAFAQHNLGFMYDNGEGVPEDLVAAYMWWNLSAAQGIEKAKKNKDIFAGQMTREQIAEAQRLSRECLARDYKGC